MNYIHTEKWAVYDTFRFYAGVIVSLPDSSSLPSIILGGAPEK